MQEAARLYNLPYETLRRRVVEKVGVDCRSGPSTVLTEYEELASYCVKMADIGLACPYGRQWFSKLPKGVEGSTP